MGRDSVPKFFNRLRHHDERKGDNEKNRKSFMDPTFEKPVEKSKKAHIWDRQKRHEEKFQARQLKVVTQNKINPWFITMHNPQGPYVTALYDFPGSNIDKKACSFIKGDHLFVESDRTEAWWNVTNSRTQKEGFIPAKFVTEEEGVDDILDSWHDIGRSECESKLNMHGLPNGTYIIRPSSNSLRIVVSVRCSDGKKHKVKHFKVEKDEGVGGYFINPSNSFKNLNDLIAYYKNSKNGSSNLLSEPWPRDGLPAIQAREVDIPLSCISLDDKLGEGRFGSIYKGQYNSTSVLVEKIKSPNISMKTNLALNHRLHSDSIVNTLGLCSELDNELLLVTEYLPGGSLRDYLLTQKKRRGFYKRLVLLLFQVVDGMDYLENMDAVHGDLRAANVFLTKENTAKIANFGLSQIGDKDSISRHKKASLRWAPPESTLTTYELDITYDVWSFAVLMFEVLTYGKIPYEGLRESEIMQKLQAGYRLPNPSSLGFECEQEIDDIMQQCMSTYPEARPTFRELLFCFDGNLHDDNIIYDTLE